MSNGIFVFVMWAKACFRVMLKDFEIKKALSAVIILFLYKIKQLDSMLPCICSVRDNRGLHISETLSCCSYHILTSSECALLLNRCTATWNLLISLNRNMIEYMFSISFKMLFLMVQKNFFMNMAHCTYALWGRRVF